MKFKMRKGKVKILLLSCDKGISLKISALTSGSFDVESSKDAHRILEDKLYESYRIIIVDLDNDPDGAYNVISFATGTSHAKNISFIAFATDITSDDAKSMTDINPDVILVQKPVPVAGIYDKIKELTQRKNKSHSPKIKKVKNTESIKLLKDSETNLFNKQSFIEKLDLFLPTNKRKNMHLLMIGIDNLEIFSALFGDDKTNSLITYLCSHLSSPIIMFAGRYSTDKLLFVINGDINTCDLILNELRLYLDNFNSKFPIILHGGACEIMPCEGEAYILTNHSLVAYIYAKYSECDEVVEYENNMKFLLWNGKESIYNTNLGDVSPKEKFDIDVPVFDDDEPSDDSKYENDFINTPNIKVDKKIENDKLSFTYSPSSEIKEDNTSDVSETNNLNTQSIFDNMEFSYEELDDIDTSINIDSPEDLNHQSYDIEIKEANDDNQFGFNDATETTNDEIKQEENSFEPPVQLSFETVPIDVSDDISDNDSSVSNEDLSFGFSEISEEDDTTSNSYIEEQNNEDAFIEEEIVEETVENDASLSFGYSDTLSEDETADLNDKVSNIQTNDSMLDAEEEVKAQDTIVEEETIETNIETVSDPKENVETQLDNDIFYDKDEFFKECNKVLKKTQNHNPLFMLTTYSEFADDISYEEFELNTIKNVFGPSAYICKYDRFEYYVFFDEDFDEEKANTYAKNLIDSFSHTRFGNVIIKLGIGIASTISYDIKNSLFYAQFAYKNLKNDKEKSSYKCFKSMNQ